jgi:putative transposase
MADKALSDCLREIKAGSSRWVRTRHDPKFSWQRRYGAFTVSESAARTVAKYIADQQVHHGRISFVDEYKTLLDRHGIDYDERYLWT